MRRFFLLILLLWLPFVTLGAAGKRAAKKMAAEARELYDQARFEEARPLLETLAQDGRSDGPLLYRLAYCQRVAGEEETSRATEERALRQLEAELDDAGNLEVPFYLSNAYRNGGRNDDARRVARETLAEIEAGTLEPGEDGSDMFRVGKLYADLDRKDAADEWFTRMLDAPAEAPETYVRWASRFLADRARDDGDTSSFDRHLARFVDAGGEPSGPEIRQLAVARYRAGEFDAASSLWKQMLGQSPPDPDRYRYASRLAQLAARLGGLPAQSPGGQPWTAVSKEDLETLMREQAERVRQTVEEAQAIDVLTSEHRKGLRSTLKDAKPIFVAAALEYTVRGFPIRETAFFGGFAPLIFRDKAWWLMRPADESVSEPVSPVTDQR